MPSPSETIPFVRSLEGVLTKRIRCTEHTWATQGYSAGAWFSVHERTVADLHGMGALLTAASAYPYVAIVRGRLLPGVDSRRCRRLCDRTRHGGAVTFEAVPRRWLAIDVDSLPAPLGCVFAAEPEAGIEHAVGCLPEPFHDAACWWQATSSAGVKPGIRCRLWFWLSRPIEDAEAKGWLASAPVDRSLYTPVALHYIAAPILERDLRDPVVRRHGIRQGLEDEVPVPAELPRLERLAGMPVELDGEELSEGDLTALAAAVMRKPRAGAIWEGERTFPDRSTGHFALAAALARGGCRDADTLHRVLIAYDRRRQHDLSRIERSDYARRTISAALAAEARP